MGSQHTEMHTQMKWVRNEFKNVSDTFLLSFYFRALQIDTLQQDWSFIQDFFFWLIGEFFSIG